MIRFQWSCALRSGVPTKQRRRICVWARYGSSAPPGSRSGLWADRRTSHGHRQPNKRSLGTITSTRERKRPDRLMRAALLGRASARVRVQISQFGIASASPGDRPLDSEQARAGRIRWSPLRFWGEGWGSGLRGDGPRRRFSDGGRAVTSERPCGQDRCLGRRQGSISSAARSAAAMASGLPVRVKTSTAVSANLITCGSPCSTARAKTSRAVSSRDCPPGGCCS